MKIGFVLDDSLDRTNNGVQQYILVLGNWLVSQHHDVHYLVGDTMGHQDKHVHSLSKNVPLRFNKNKLSIPLPANKTKIASLLAKEKFDVLHVQMPHSPLMAARVVSAAPEETAIVGTFHIAPYSFLVSGGSTLLGGLLKRNLRRFDRIISVSSAAQDFAKKTFKVESVVLPNVISPSAFNVSQKQLTSTKVQIVFLGRLTARKGCAQLLKALNKAKNNNWNLVIAGTGELEKKLMALASKLGLSKQVKFVGYVSDEQKMALLAGADIAVFPSLGGESFGIVLIEAMAAGAKVTLGGDNAGYKTVLGQWPDTLINPRNTEEFAARLNSFIADKRLRDAIGAMQHKAVKQYAVSLVGPKIVEVYKSAIAKKTTKKHNVG